MRIELTTPSRLDPQQWAAWAEMLGGQAAFDSPFFTPGFVQAVASVRSDVEVALLYEGDRLAGFFPFQRTRRQLAQPVGAGFSEFHGVITTPDLKWNVPELLRGCRLLAWNYDHVPSSQLPFTAFHQRLGGSPYMDLSGGFENYCADRQDSGSSVIRQAARKLRKLEREVGPVEFKLHDAGDRALDRLIAWKSAQHVRTGVVDVFRRPWVIELLRRVHAAQRDSFAGVMSVLSAGGRPIAVHLGLRTDSVAHVWYPAYDPDFGEYSPGMIMFLEMARELAAQGVRRVDLGPTPQRYKQSLKSGDIEVAVGTADRFALARAGRRVWQNCRRKIRASALGIPASVPARWLVQLRRWRATG